MMNDEFVVIGGLIELKIERKKKYLARQILRFNRSKL